MNPPFFPDPAFAWTFYAALVGLAAVAAVIDLRTAVIPKWLSLTTLGLGFAFNVARGAFLGARGMQLTWLETGGPWLGALDGFLFALVGFLLSFVIFFVLWILGTCGGGDVKLFAAVGAWVGVSKVLILLLGSLVVLMVLFVIKFATAGLSPSKIQKALRESTRAGQAKGKPALGKLRITYSLPIAVSAAVLLLFLFRYELHLEAPPQPDASKVQAHAR